MDDWKKIGSYNRAYEAEIRQQILRNNSIGAVVVRKQDSSFGLFGTFELYIPKSSQEIALIVLNEYKGWSKINSFSLKRPVDISYSLLQEKGFELQKTYEKNLNEHQLFVKNEAFDQAYGYLSALEGWRVVCSTRTQKQAALRGEQLTTYSIDYRVLKRRNSEKHIEQVDILVAEGDVPKTKDVLNEMVGWYFVESDLTMEKAELHEKLLEDHGIVSLLKFKTTPKDEIQSVEHYVRYQDIELSRELIAQSKDWVKIAEYDQYYKAQMYEELLLQNNIAAHVVNRKGSMFLLGEIALFVERTNAEEALNFIKNSSFE